MSDFTFNTSNSAITFRDLNGNNRPDASDRIVINGHTYLADRIKLLSPQHPDRQAWENLKATLKVSNFNSITSLKAAQEVFQIRSTTPFPSPIQFPGTIQSCKASVASLDYANELAKFNGMGRTDHTTCSMMVYTTNTPQGGVGIILSFDLERLFSK